MKLLWQQRENYYRKKISYMAKITNITGLEIFDSTGIPALEVTILTDEGTIGTASCATELFPSPGMPTDIKDNDGKRFRGYGQRNSIQKIENLIKPKLIGVDVTDQREIDKILMNIDQSIEKSVIGLNTMLSTSMAVAKAAASHKRIPLYLYLQEIIGLKDTILPMPMFTMIDGGRNANFSTDFHEFFIVPGSFKNFQESLEIGINLHNSISDILLRENILPFVGQKGGLGPLLSTNEDALSLIAEGLEVINIRLGYDVYIGIDSNANSFVKEGYYKIKDRSSSLHTSELIDYYKDMAEKYHILYFEDPLSDDDSAGWTSIFMALNSNAIIAGDFYTMSNPLKMQTALEKKTINGIVIKPSFVGTVTESLAIASIAKLAGLRVIVSDRISETNETFLADFSVAIGADYVRFGAPVRGERVTKHNRLLHIAKELEMKK